MRDLEQQRRTVKVLELMDASHTAHQHGEDWEPPIDEAIELDAAAVSVIKGGITIGMIPNPETHPAAWQDYLDANRNSLAVAEAERSTTEARADGGTCPYCGASNVSESHIEGDWCRPPAASSSSDTPTEGADA